MQLGKYLQTFFYVADGHAIENLGCAGDIQVDRTVGVCCAYARVVANSEAGGGLDTESAEGVNPECGTSASL